MSTEQAVAELVRTAAVVLSTGKQAQVHVCKVKDIPEFTSFVGVLFTELHIRMDDLGGLQAQLEEQFRDPGFILQLIAKHGHMVFEMASRLTDLSVEEVKDLDLDDAVAVLSKLVEVNYDFFTLRVIPALKGMLVARGQKKALPEKT